MNHLDHELQDLQRKIKRITLSGMILTNILGIAMGWFLRAAIFG